MSTTLRIVSAPSAAPPTTARTRPIARREHEQERDAEEPLDRDAHQRGRRELVELSREGESEVDEQERDRREAGADGAVPGETAQAAGRARTALGVDRALVAHLTDAQPTRACDRGVCRARPPQPGDALAERPEQGGQRRDDQRRRDRCASSCAAATTSTIPCAAATTFAE